MNINLRLELTYSMQVMNINLQPKKCSGQSRYGHYGSYATEVSFSVMSRDSSSENSCHGTQSQIIYSCIIG